MRTLVVTLLLAATARAETPHATLSGVVVDASSLKPLDDATLDLCRRAPVDPPVGWEAPSHTCGVASSAKLSDQSGRFELPLWEPAASLPPEAQIVVERIGYMRRTVDRKWLLAALTKKSPAYIALVPGANLRGEVRPDGAAAAWITRGARTIHYGRCSVADDGRFDCARMIVPGEVTVFALENGRLGRAQVRLKGGEEKAITIDLRDPVFGFSGSVVGDDGLPVVAIVRAEPIELSDATLVDRVLLHEDSYHTSLGGEFGFNTASRTPVRVRVSTWAQDPAGRTHTGERLLGETIVTPQQPPTEITLAVKGPPVVRCTAVGAGGAELLIDQISVRLLDFSHDKRTHAGRCLGTFAAQPTRQARFFWPEPARRIEVSVLAGEVGGGSARKRFEGRLELAGPGEECRIPVAPE